MISSPILNRRWDSDIPSSLQLCQICFCKIGTSSIANVNFPYLRCMLSKKTKYGLKALTFLAAQKGRTPVQISEIAKHENISQKFLESILLTLRKTGLLGSKKGKGGGYYLIKEPKDIPMTTVMRVLEGPIAMVPCVSLNFYEKCEDCPDEASCSVHKLMLQVRDSKLEIFRINTLADTVP